MSDGAKTGIRVSQLVGDLESAGQNRYRAMAELGEIDHPHAEAAILAGLMDDRDPAMLRLAAEAAGKRRIEAAREKLEALTRWSPERAPAKHEPEPWVGERHDETGEDANEEGVRQAAVAALALLHTR